MYVVINDNVKARVLREYIKLLGFKVYSYRNVFMCVQTYVIQTLLYVETSKFNVVASPITLAPRLFDSRMVTKEVLLPPPPRSHLSFLSFFSYLSFLLYAQPIDAQ